MHIVRWVVGASVFLALLFLSLQNSEPAELKFFNIASMRAPLVVVVFVAFVVGVAIGLLTGTVRAARLNHQISKLRRENRAHHGPTTPTSGRAAPDSTPGSRPGYGRGDNSHDGR